MQSDIYDRYMELIDDLKEYIKECSGFFESGKMEFFIPTTAYLPTNLFIKVLINELLYFIKIKHRKLG